MSCLIKAICNWINTPEEEEVRLTGIYHFGTASPLSRAYLRHVSGLHGTLTKWEAFNPVYEEEWKQSKKQRILEDIPDVVVHIDDACKKAREWLNK
jgi:hypothetical protein